MSTIASPEQEFETTTLPPFAWRFYYADQGHEWVTTSDDTPWHAISEPLLVDSHLFQVTKYPVHLLEIDLPILDVHGQRVIVSLSPPEDTPVFYFKRMAASPTSAASQLLYAAYGYVTKAAVVQVRIMAVRDDLRVQPLFLPRPLVSPF